MTTAVISEVAKIHGGGRLGLSGNDFIDGADIPAYGAAGLNGHLTTAEYVDQPAVILSSIGARCGKCFLVDGAWTSLANTQVIIPDRARVDPTFLWYQLNDERRWHRSGSAQPFIKPSDVKSHQIYLPPLPEQRRIAAILEHADALRAKRRQVLAHLDSMTQAIFYDMFGNPETWSSRWPMGVIGDMAESVQYGTSGKAGDSGEWPILRMGNITDNGRLDLGDLKYIDLSATDVPKYTVRRGDMLFNRTNSREKVGKTAVVDTDEPLALAGYLVRVRFKPEHRPEFVSTYMTSTHGLAVRQRLAKAAVNQANINATEMRGIAIAMPPAELQVNFASRVERVNEQRAVVLRGLADDDRLFASLQSRAFRGEL